MPKENILVMLYPQVEKMDSIGNSWVVQEDETGIQYKRTDSFQMACFKHIDYQGSIVTFDLLLNVIKQNEEMVKELSKLSTPYLLPVCET